MPLEVAGDGGDAPGENPPVVGVTGGERAPGGAGRHQHRQRQVLGQPYRAVPAGRGVDVRSGYQDRVFRRGQPLAQPAKRFLGNHGVPVHAPVFQVPKRAGIRVLVPVIQRQRKVDRPGRRGGRLQDRVRQRLRGVLRAGRLVAPLHQRLDQPRRVHVSQVSLQLGVLARLLAGGDDHRHVPGLGVDQVPHRVAGARRGVQVHQRRSAGGLRVPVRHPDRRALLQRQDVAEVIGHAAQHRQLVGAGVAEDGGDPVAAQDLVEGVPYVHEYVPPCGWHRAGRRSSDQPSAGLGERSSQELVMPARDSPGIFRSGGYRFGSWV
jgi:hypothetical protein